ncbi:MAG TPA: hypothetical protein VGG45_07650 [Terracidiphilus sp.]
MIAALRAPRGDTKLGALEVRFGTSMRQMCEMIGKLEENYFARGLYFESARYRARKSVSELAKY